MMILILVTVGVWRRRPLLAVTTIGAWIFLFEIPYHWTNVFMWGWTWNSALLWTIGYGGWVLAAFYAGLRPSYALLATFAVLWLGWIATGFHYNYPSDHRLDWTAEFFNEATKTSLGLAYLLGALRMPATQHRRPQAPPEATSPSPSATTPTVQPVATR